MDKKGQEPCEPPTAYLFTNWTITLKFKQLLLTTQYKSNLQNNRNLSWTHNLSSQISPLRGQFPIRCEINGYETWLTGNPARGNGGPRGYQPPWRNHYRDSPGLRRGEGCKWSLGNRRHGDRVLYGNKELLKTIVSETQMGQQQSFAKEKSKERKYLNEA